MKTQHNIRRSLATLSSACVIFTSCGFMNVNANTINQQIKPINDLKFTSTLNYKSKNNKKEASESETGIKSDVTYNTDSTSATLHIEYTDSSATLSLTNDSKDFYKDVFDKGLLTQKDTASNVIEFETDANGVYCFDVNVTNANGEVIDTQAVRFKVLDIADKDEVREDTNQVSEQDAKETKNSVATQSTSTVETNHDSKNMSVHYTSNGSYAWTIPSDIDLNSQDTLTVSATKINEEANASLKIKMSSENDYKLKTAAGVAGSYSISKDGNKLGNNTTILETTSKGTSTADLKFTANPGNFMVADTYNDTLTFTAMNGYAAGTVLNIAGKKYIVVTQTDNDTYELISGESIGNIQFQANQDSNGNYYDVGKYNENDLPNTRYDGQNSNTYEDSYIDKYLSDTYYNSLPDELKNAIVDTQIKQAAYSFDGSNSKWRWFGDTSTSPDGTASWFYNEGTESNPKWIRWDKVNLPDDASGAYPLKYMSKKEKGYNGQTYNTITRKVFLPSVEEISNLVDLNNANKVYSFLKGTNNSLSHMWTRDTNSGSPRSAVYLLYDFHSLNYSDVTDPWVGVRPAFVVDLSTISDVTVVDAVSYK